MSNTVMSNTVMSNTVMSNTVMSNIPWVEKYRPDCFNKLILDPLNKSIFDNMIKKNYIPNLLLFGPPGTGKTTTIMNLIKIFQKNNNQLNKGLMIHLNASDERGIDTIRSQITQFVNSQSFFFNGIKFVILDEVDYMTKNAQHALKYIIQDFHKNVRFCLICNYISKIDETLQNDLLRLRFNKLPKPNIIVFLDKICKSENINISTSNLNSIQQMYKSDIRSMINYIQTNENNITHILDSTIWDDFIEIIKSTNDYKLISIHFNKISEKYNMVVKNIIKDFLNYIIINKKEYVSKQLLDFTEFILHIPNAPNEYIINYFSISLHEILNLNCEK